MKNKFKLFENKTSIAKRDCRYVQGGITEESGSKLAWWERKTFETGFPDDTEFTITNQYNKRPDLVSFLFFDNAKYDWLILQYNNIIDLNEEFCTGKIILVPSRNRVTQELTSYVVNRKK